MALITKFAERRSAKVGWRSEVECGYNVGAPDGRRVLRPPNLWLLEPSDSRKGKPIDRIDEDAARELVRILHKAFPSVRSSRDGLEQLAEPKRE